MGEVRLNTWSGPSPAVDRAGRVTFVDQSTKKKPKLAVAIVAVVVPLLAIAVAAVLTTTSNGNGSATATTLSQDGDPDATAPASGIGSGGGKAGVDGSTSATSTTKPNKANRPDTADDVPSRPQDAGPEGERASVTYPQPTIPEGGCSRPSGTVTITLGSKPSPSCIKVDGDQVVVFRNRTGKEISLVAIGVNEVVAAGSEVRVGRATTAFGDGRSTFWSPGNPQLSGIVIVG